MPLKVQSRAGGSKTVKQARPGKPADAALPFGLPAPPKGAKQLPDGISLCMIVKNEERYLEQCLQSVADIVDEICIVDTGSTDGTVAIAERFGAKVQVHAWRDDFSWARNKALEMATKRWIFVLDADEELAAASRDSLRQMKHVPAGDWGLYVRCENLSDDYKGTGSMSHLLARLFPNNPKFRYISPIHEYISADGNEMGIDTKLSDIVIVHHGYLQDIVAERNKATRNLSIVRRATQEHPQDPFHWYNLGMTAHVVKDFEEAIFAFEKMRTILNGQGRGFLPQALVTLAECYQEARNDMERALSIIEECLQGAPKLSNAHFTKGRILVKLGRRDEAREAFIEAIEDAKHRHVQFIVDDQVYKWKAQLCLGVSYAEEQKWDEAILWYERGLQNQPNVQPLLFNRAHALEGAKRFDEAEHAFRETYERFDDEVSTVQYINFLLRRNDKQRAFEMMEKTAGNVSPRCAATFFVAAAAFAQRMGNPLEELGFLQRAQQCDPSAGPVLDALEMFYSARGDQAMLAQLHASELSYEPVEAPDFVRRSFRLIALGRHGDALEVAERGLKLAPLDAKLRYNAAAACVELKRVDEALNHLRVIPMDSSEISEKSLMLRAVLLRQAGREADALEVLELFLAIKPGQIDAILHMAQCLEALGRTDDAVAVLEASLPLDRHRIAIELASMHLRLGRFADAQRVSEQALASP